MYYTHMTMSFSILDVQSWSDGQVVLFDDGNYYYIDDCDNEESYVLIGPVPSRPSVDYTW